MTHILSKLVLKEIVPALEMEQPNISRHLHVWKKEGILSCRKEGLRVIYRVNDPKVFQLLDLCQELLKNHWEKSTEDIRLTIAYKCFEL